MSPAPRLRRPSAFTLVELAVTVVILMVLSVIAIPTFATVLSATKHNTSADLLVHMNQFAEGLAATEGESAPTYADFAAAATEVYYVTTANKSAPLTTTTANSTVNGQVSVTLSGTGASQVTGLAMVSSDGTVSVFLRSSATPGASPAVWTCATVSASSVSAAAGTRTC